jgi:pyrroline-5-carboxylate reductase
MDVIVLAVKPQQLRDVIGALAPFIQHQLLLTIAAGIRTTDISRWLNSYPTIVRAMPNTPALIGKGITGLYAMPGVSEQQKKVADDILRSVGLTSWLDKEDLIDAVTAVSAAARLMSFILLKRCRKPP